MRALNPFNHNCTSKHLTSHAHIQLFFEVEKRSCLRPMTDLSEIVRHLEFKCRDTSRFRSRDSPLTRWADRKFHSTAMLLLGRRQLALISSGLKIMSLRPMLTITPDYISLITDILEVRRNLQSLHPKMQELAIRFVLSPTGKTLYLTFGC